MLRTFSILCACLIASSMASNDLLDAAGRLLKGLACREDIKSGLTEKIRLGRAHLDQVDGVPVLHLYGSRIETARQYGRILKKPLAALHSYVTTIIPDEMLKPYLAEAALYERNLPEGFRSELKAVSEESGMPYPFLLALNVIPKLHCSCFAAWGGATRDGQMIMGRNMDYPAFGLEDRGSLLVVHHPDKGFPLASVGFIGMIGSFTGMNVEGVSYGNMLVFNAKHPQYNKDGLPVQYLLREAAMTCRDADSFAKHLLDAQHLIPMNVLVADKKKAVVLELGTDIKSRRNPAPGKDYIAASNHFRLPQMAEAIPGCDRYASIVVALEGVEKTIDTEVAQSILGDSIIQGLNIQAAIFEPGKMRFKVSVNKIPAAPGPYTAFDLSTLLRCHSQGMPQ